MMPTSGWTSVAATLALATFIAAAAPENVSAQAWTRPAGHAYLKLSRGHAIATERFEVDGTRVAFDQSDANASFRDESYYLYGEFGISRRLTLVGQIPYKRLELRQASSDGAAGSVGSASSAGSVSRVSSVQIGLRLAVQDWIGFTDDRHRTSLSGVLNLPTGYVRNHAPSVGAGQADFDAIAAYGLSMYPAPAYAQLAAGYRHRSNAYGLSRTVACDPPANGCVTAEELQYDNEWLLRAELGVTVGNRLLMQALVHGTWSNSPPESEFDPSNPIATRQRFTKVGVGGAVYPVPFLGVSVQVFDTIGGNNTIDTVDWFFGIEYITDRR